MEFIAILFMVVVVLLGQVYLYTKQSFKKFEYTCRFTKDEVTEGDEIGLLETVSNRKWLPLPWIKTELSTSRWLEYAGSQSEVVGERRFVPSFFALKSFQKISRNWKVNCLKRGVFTVHQVDVVGSDLLGLTSFSHPVQVNATLTVLPRPLDEEELASLPRYLNGDVVVRRHLIDDPFYVAGVRDYTGHEPMNRIHWSATARENKMMVFQNQYTSRKKMAVLLNCQPRRGASSHMDGEPQMEDCIRFCTYLFSLASEGDTPFRFLCNGTDSGSGQQILSGESWGQSFALEQTRTLARLQADKSVSFGEFVRRDDLALDATELVIVTTHMDAVIRDFAEQQAAAGVSVSIFVRGVVLDQDRSDLYEIFELFGKKEAAQ